MTRFRGLMAFTLVAGLVGLSGSTWADDAGVPARPTFYKDVLPILQENCQTCHRPSGADMGGMVAPMSLIAYDEVRPWAKSLAREVSERTMPPWFATAATHGIFANERVLTDSQIDTIKRWAETGAAPGDKAQAPAAKNWETSPGGWAIGEPDLIINLSEPFWVSDDVVDLNITLAAEELTKDLLPEPRYIASAEFKPGSYVVHHIIGSRRSHSSESPEASGMIGGIAPGTDPFYLPAGYGRLLEPGAQIFFQMHYNKESGPGTGTWDRSQIGIKFHSKDAKIDRVAEWQAIGNHTFEIPPQHGNWKVGASMTFPNDSTIFAYLPHMHLRGKAAKYVAYFPDGTQETLLDVPKYDFNWQINYTYKEPRRIPAGTRIDVTMWFENTPERAEITKPAISPAQAVRFGGPTTDEMMLGWLDFAEEISIEAAKEKQPAGPVASAR